MLTPRDLPHYVYGDYEQWEGRWELIEGIAYSMVPSPSYLHQRISQEIARLLGGALNDCKWRNQTIEMDDGIGHRWHRCTHVESIFCLIPKTANYG